MTIIITKTKLTLGILAGVLVGATVVAASDGVFTDNPSGTYYHDPVEWAYDNGITTGTSATTFSPMDPVTRGQNVTFAYRYDQNIVQPALDVLEAGPEISHFLYMTTHTDNSVTGDHEQIRDLVEISKRGEDTDLIITVSGHGDVVGSYCHWSLRMDGATSEGNTGTAGYISTGGANAVQFESGSYFIQGVFTELGAGDHTLELWLRGNATECTNNPGNFGHSIVAMEVQSNS